jgi:hypothetical protein
MRDELLEILRRRAIPLNTTSISITDFCAIAIEHYQLNHVFYQREESKLHK